MVDGECVVTMWECVRMWGACVTVWRYECVKGKCERVACMCENVGVQEVQGCGWGCVVMWGSFTSSLSWQCTMKLTFFLLPPSSPLHPDSSSTAYSSCSVWLFFVLWSHTKSFTSMSLRHWSSFLYWEPQCLSWMSMMSMWDKLPARVLLLSPSCTVQCL